MTIFIAQPSGIARGSGGGAIAPYWHVDQNAE